MAGAQGKSLAKAVVALNWMIVGVATLITLTMFSFCFGKLDATNTFLEAFRTDHNDKRISELKEVLENSTDLLTFYSVSIGVSILVQTLLNALLTAAVNKSDQRKLSIWLFFNVIRMCISMYYFVRKLTGIQNDNDDVNIFAHLAELIWIGGSLMIVNHFRFGLMMSSADTDFQSQEENPAKVTVMKV